MCIPHFHQPAPVLLASGFLTADELKKAVDDHVVTTVLLAVPDLGGRLRGKRFNARVFLERMLERTEMCGYVVAADAGMVPLEDTGLTGWDTGFGDLLVWPDLDTIRHLPYDPGTVLVHGDLTHPDGAPVDVSPRQMLRAQLGRLRSLGFEVKAGLESEFVLYHGTPQQLRMEEYAFLRPVFPGNGDYSLDHPPDLTSFFTDMEKTLADAGAPVESVKTESAPGQVEFAFPYGEAMRACDGYTVYRHAVLAITAGRGMTPNFMAAPQTGVGSGLHLHLSLWRDGHNLFAARPDDGDLTDMLQQSIAGLVSGLPDLTPLYAPTPNSYKRFRPHSFAPTGFTWGFDNRTCAVRITRHGPGRHLELRLPGADANPYLALTASLTAICHGITKQPELPAPCEGNAYQNTSAPPIARDLADATADFAHSDLALTALGPDVVRHYTRAAQREIDYPSQRVTDIERMRGFDRA